MRDTIALHRPSGTPVTIVGSQLLIPWATAGRFASVKATMPTSTAMSAILTYAPNVRLADGSTCVKRRTGFCMVNSGLSPNATVYTRDWWILLTNIFDWTINTN
jgi:hypothetical protein